MIHLMQLAGFSVVCPEECREGAAVDVFTPDGQALQVVVPAGVGPGMEFTVTYAPIMTAGGSSAAQG